MVVTLDRSFDSYFCDGLPWSAVSSSKVADVNSARARPPTRAISLLESRRGPQNSHSKLSQLKQWSSMDFVSWQSLFGHNGSMQSPTCFNRSIMLQQYGSKTHVPLSRLQVLACRRNKSRFCFFRTSTCRCMDVIVIDDRVPTKGRTDPQTSQSFSSQEL